MSGEGGDLDVIAVASEGGLACVQVFFIRGGRNLGNKAFFPKHTEDAEPADILAAFIPQFYLHGQGGRDRPVIEFKMGKPAVGLPRTKWTKRQCA